MFNASEVYGMTANLDLDHLMAEQRRFFASGETRGYEFRREQLRRLRDALQRYEPRLLEALKKDMGKPEYEAFLSELAVVIEELDMVLKRLKFWMKPRRVPTPITVQPSSSRIISEPLGQVLIIGPWNYPVLLLISPLVGALAAGNVVVVKPSEQAPHTSQVIADLVADVFPPHLVAVVQGGADAAQALLARKFDHIFFTGGAAVGRIVARAAAEQLTPVTLELGGKSPCIVDRTADLEAAVQRIAWSKFFNAGQTCVATDYLLVDQAVSRDLLDRLVRQIRASYGPDPAASPDYARIVNDSHFARLQGLLERGEIVIGGQTDPAARYIAPTVITGVSLEDPIMQEEVFGPILPVLEYRSLDEAIDTVRRFPKPLALYVFTSDRQTEERVLSELSFGGGCVNNTILHLSTPHLPFGGVGASGFGAYHGKHSFDTFSHHKGVLKSSTRFFPPLLSPPYGWKLGLIRRLLEIKRRLWL